MKVKHLFLAVLFIHTLAHSQYKLSKKQIVWSEDLKASKKSTLSDLLTGAKGDFFAIKHQRKGFYGLSSSFSLEHFDKNMKFLKANEIEIMFEKKELKMENLVFYGNELLLFSSFSNTKLKKNFLFVQTVNQNTLKLNDDLKKVAEISFEKKSRYNNGNYGFEVSRDSSKMLVYYNMPYDKKDNEKYGFHVFDINMKELWHKQVVLPYSDQLFDVQDYEVSNNSDVYLVGKLYDEKFKESIKDEPNYAYKIIAYKDAGNVSVTSDIELKDKYIQALNIAINNNDEIIGTGFYSNSSGQGVKGVFFTRLNKETGKIEKQSYKEFGVDFIKQNLTIKEEKKVDKKIKKGDNVEMYKYYLDNIVFKEDGGVVIVAEQYFVRTSTYTVYSQNGGSRTYTTYHYYYNDIIVSSISPEGDIVWTEKIAKRQRTSNDQGFYSSYALAVKDNKLYFIFNDNVKNYFDNKQGEYFNGFAGGLKSSVVTMVILDTDGNKTKEVLFNTKDQEIIIRPKVCEQLNDELVIFGQKKKTQKYAKVKL